MPKSALTLLVLALTVAACSQGESDTFADSAGSAEAVLTAADVNCSDEAVRGLQSRVRLLFQDARLLMWQRVLNNVGLTREAAA